VATDLDDEFEEVKLHIDTDMQGVSLGFKVKPPDSAGRRRRAGPGTHWK
jgi:hypothetical protein